jgi:hypothetical protein
MTRQRAESKPRNFVHTCSKIGGGRKMQKHGEGIVGATVLLRLRYEDIGLPALPCFIVIFFSISEVIFCTGRQTYSLL